MVPVKISLSNFLSYGAEAQSLDFSRFRVACLSGKNGQGKSALLDAITWALWGEARKSSGAQKPDEELLRIGARRMSVEFVFDIEGQRYLVLRSYSRSATGKTSKSILELQIMGSEKEGDIIPLTGASIRETQQKLNECLGLDYDAFVNSSMLLQGRSDEFTKKKPSERKNILGRILNLGRYDRLADRARAKQQALNTEAERAGREIELLLKTINDEPEWDGALRTVMRNLEDEQAVLSVLHKEEAALTEKVGALQSITREYAAVRDTLKKTSEQHRERREELQKIDLKLDDSAKLIASKSIIQADYERYVTLLKERDELDLVRDVYRGLEKQLDTAKSALAVKRAELEGTIKRHELEIRHKQQVSNDLSAEVEKKQKLEIELDNALKAETRLEELTRQGEKYAQLKETAVILEQKIEGEQKRLRGTLDVLEEQLKDKSDKKDMISSLKEEIDKISREGKELGLLQERLEKITEDGQAIGHTITEFEITLAGFENEIEKLALRLEQLRQQNEGKCPTCGSSLGKEQLRDLIERLGAELEAQERDRVKLKRALKEKQEHRNILRNDFKSLSSEAKSLADRVNVGATLRERLVQSQEDQAQYESLLKKARLLRDQLESSRFAENERASLENLALELATQKVNENTVAEYRFKSAQIDHYKEKLRAISFAEGKKENLVSQLQHLKENVIELRTKLDSGEAFSKKKDEIKRIEGKLRESAFDPARYEYVRDGLKKGRAIPEKMKDLANAEKNYDEWLTEKERLKDILAQLKENVLALENKGKELQSQLASEDVLKTELLHKKKEREESEIRLTKLQQNRGEVQARIQQISEAKVQLKTAKTNRKKTEEALSIYKKLRTAFGKSGIQSLIIEQALPEIEERASEILFRLTEGKMQVHLETIKDKKSGGTKETLEIVITDDQGMPRSYETYSGGEAFRINFALRIALSQILAERNGVRIRTLGIDEGFGTQDEEGIQYLIEAIQEVQDDFEKIIVITHLDRLKEAFPVRIEVVKDPIMGSQLTVIES